ncbi:MAG TPA: carboxypeptidase-like regulatory domain-containing protein, partial [Bryobacteraceae bacterium]|nr:carboxypeptidase-like regulatory domain-containing protein [Bryobacteraceae bacterium]
MTAMTRPLARVSFGLFLLAGSMLAQSTLGTILGTVTDPSGAIVVGATVQITNVDEGSSYTATTDVHGDYTQVNLKPAHYKIEVTQPGFQSETVRN